MCGIAGLLGPTQPELDRTSDALGKALYHRGPDDGCSQLLDIGEGCNLLLVHRRLSILELSELGRQPMLDPGRGDWIVFNGEIYNWRALRAQLEAKGESFRSQSDTEVLLKGISREGPAFLKELCGMFAFAHWSAGRRELLLAVDHLGIKPLYYASTVRGVCFASELRALLKAGLVEPRVEPAALESYLAFGAVQDPLSILKGVRSLPPGCMMTVKADGTSSEPRPYWRPPFVEAGDESGNESTAEELRGLLSRVVKEHSLADVPVGLFLSGGVDSSLLAVLAARGGDRLKSFSVTFGEQEFSEAPYSRAVAKKAGLDHTELELASADFKSCIGAACAAMDQPTLDGMNVYVISKAVRQTGIKAVLSGQGGDEVFGGYPTFRWAPLAAAWRRRLRIVPAALARAASAWDGLTRPAAMPGKLSQAMANAGDVPSMVWLMRQVFPRETRRRLFPAGPGEAGPEGLLPEEASLARQACSRLDPINAVSWLELRGYLGSMLLRDGDFMSMAHSLEVRVPFLDRRVVEWAARQPGRGKMSRNLPKPLLLGAAGADIPDCVYRRPKQGFTFPWPQWLKHDLRPMAEAAIMDRRAFESLGMSPDAVGGLWRDFLAGRRSVSWARVWALVALREYVKGHGLSL